METKDENIQNENYNNEVNKSDDLHVDLLPEQNNITVKSFDFENSNLITSKRNISEIEDDDNKKKKKKEDISKDNFKEKNKSCQNKNSTLDNRRSTSSKYQTNRQNYAINVNSTKFLKNSDSSIENTETEETEKQKNENLKVPPLKIVLPAANESDQSLKNGKSSTVRHYNFPYVVTASSEDNCENIVDSLTYKSDERISRDFHFNCNNVLNLSEEKSQRITRNSQKSVSPVPTDCDSEMNEDNSAITVRNIVPNLSSSLIISISNSSASPLKTDDTKMDEMHPRKRKLKKDSELSSSSPPVTINIPPGFDQPFMNGYEMYFNIRKQIEKRRKNMFPVQPKPPQGFKDYLMNRCTYILAGNAVSQPAVHVVPTPQYLPPTLKELFTEQEKERYRLRLQHLLEKEKLVLSVEQEILRVHGRAARALANQSLPFSVCAILKDEEIYNPVTPEQDRNARSRYNGRLFLSWLQDVDDKWDKIKEAMLLRHHNEAESLHAVQRMDWEWKVKELQDCKSSSLIDELFVPMVSVSNSFDLNPG